MNQEELDKKWDVSAALPIRRARTFDQARAVSQEFRGRDLVNRATGLAARVSNNSLGKMLHEKAVGKSESPAAHAMAVANLDGLYERAALGWSKPDVRGDANFAAIHRFFAPFLAEGRAYLAKITVLEMADGVTPNRIYSVESVGLNEKSPSAPWVAASADADGISLTSTRSAGDILSLAQKVQDYNAERRR